MTPAVIGLIFTIVTIAYGLSSPLVSWVSERLAVRNVIAGGTVAMALTLPLLSLSHGDRRLAVGLCLVSIATPSCSTRPRRSWATPSIGAVSHLLRRRLCGLQHRLLGGHDGHRHARLGRLPQS